MEWRAFDLIGWRRFQHIAEEYRTVAYDQFSLMQPIENLDVAV
jgi:hypothetical protein